MTKIIAPAKDIKNLGMVIDAGADMAYAGISGFCRKQKDSVRLEQFHRMAQKAKEKGGALIAAMNLMPPVGGVGRFVNVAGVLVNNGARGFIFNDPGVIKTAKSLYPGIYVMASAGLSPLNSGEVRFLQQAGADTVLLSEFLTPKEIFQIKQETGAGLELFATGVKEFGYTGKCILSSYYHQEYKQGVYQGSAKRSGACSTVCKEPFTIIPGLEPGCCDASLTPRRFNLSDKMEELLPYVDVIKLMQGAVDSGEFIDTIKKLAAIVRKNRAVKS